MKRITLMTSDFVNADAVHLTRLSLEYEIARIKYAIQKMDMMQQLSLRVNARINLFENTMYRL